MTPFHKQDLCFIKLCRLLFQLTKKQVYNQQQIQSTKDVRVNAIQFCEDYSILFLD